MKKLVFSALLVLQSVLVLAQNAGSIKAKVVDSKTQKPLQNVVAAVQNLNLTSVTNVAGEFVIKNVPAGNQILLVKTAGYKDQLFSLEVLFQERTFTSY